MNILNLFLEGGFVMIPLLICSLIVWAVTFEKIYFLKKIKLELGQLHEKASELIQDNKIHEAKGLGHGLHPLVKTPFLAMIESRELETSAWESRVSRRVSESQQGLKKSLWILGTVGSSAPFIGLFGTVVGIIKSFDSIAQAGKGGFSVVAAGLSEALIATAAGIIVAVMAVVLYNYFQTRLQNLNLEFKNKIEDLMDLF